MCPMPTAPFGKRYSFIFPPENELMLFEADPLPRVTFAHTYSQAEPPPPKRGRGYDLRKNLLIALCNQKRGIVCALRVFVASRGVKPEGRGEPRRGAPHRKGVWGKPCKGFPQQKPATKSPGAERSEAKNPPFMGGVGVGENLGKGVIGENPF